MKRLLSAGVAALLLAALMALAGSPAGADVRTGPSARVVHAIPGSALDLAEALPVDISVDGACALTAVEFGDVAGPLELPETVDIDISLSDGACGGAVVISVDDLALTVGEQVSIVAQLDADGAPTAAVYADDLAATTTPGDGVAAVRHAAAAPAVEVWLGADEAAPTGLAISNGEQVGRVELAPGTYQAGLGTSEDLVFGPADLPVTANQVIAVYAVGVFGEDSFQLITDSFPLPATVRIVHGIPGTALDADLALPVDVSVDGVCVLPAFEFGGDPAVVALEPDTYDIEIGLADDTPCSATPVITASGVAVTAGLDASIVAHLDADGAPTASVFVNDVTPTVPATRGAVSVRHTAAAPAVEVWLGADEAAATGLVVENGEQVERVDLAPGTYQAGLGTAEDLLFGPADLPVTADELIAVYAVGVFGEDSFQLVTETIPLSAGDSGDGGYALVSADTSVTAFGTFGDQGSTETPLVQPVVGATATSTDDGYWMVAGDGGVFAYGDAGFYGSAGDIALNQPVVGLDASDSDEGYWLVASDGGVFAYGDAGFYGSAGALPLNQPVVGLLATPSGAGYWLVASDGGVFAYGDAGFLGSLGDLTLNAPIVDIAATPSGAGYWLVAADGGVFTFGDADFYGSAAGSAEAPVVGIISSETGAGYRIVTESGTVFAYGDATALEGDDVPADVPVVDIIG